MKISLILSTLILSLMIVEKLELVRVSRYYSQKKNKLERA
jgi:hypothetical protein